MSDDLPVLLKRRLQAQVIGLTKTVIQLVRLLLDASREA